MEHEDEFAAWAARVWPGLVRSAVGLGCSLADAEDVAQTTLLKACAAWTRVRAADDRDAYTYRILLNATRDSWRRPWRREHAVEQPPDSAVHDRIADVEAADALRRALARLSRPHREVVVLRHLVQLSEAQTAAALGIAPGTVKSRLSRALAALAGDTHLQSLQQTTTGAPDA